MARTSLFRLVVAVSVVTVFATLGIDGCKADHSVAAGPDSDASTDQGRSGNFDGGGTYPGVNADAAGALEAGPVDASGDGSKECALVGGRCENCICRGMLGQPVDLGRNCIYAKTLLACSNDLTRCGDRNESVACLYRSLPDGGVEAFQMPTVPWFFSEGTAGLYWCGQALRNQVARPLPFCN